MDKKNDKKKIAKGLLDLLDRKQLLAEIAAARDSHAGQDLQTKDTDEQLLDWLVEKAADLLPGVPQAARLTVACYPGLTVWDEGAERDVDEAAGLVGVVVIDGMQWLLDISIDMGGWNYDLKRAFGSEILDLLKSDDTQAVKDLLRFAWNLMSDIQRESLLLCQEAKAVLSRSK